MKRLSLFACICTLLFSAVSAHAIEFGVDVASQGLRSYTESANAWSKSRVFGGINLRGEVGLNENWRIGFGWHYAGTDASLHGFPTSLSRHDLTVDGRYRYPVLNWLVPYARVGVGAAKSRLTLNNWETTNWSPQVQAGLGVELLLPASVWSKKESPLPAFGVFFETAWQMVFDQDATLTAGDTPQPGVQSSDLKLGTLSLNGVMLRFGAAVRF